MSGRRPPEFALSVQQPWAWAILFAGKDVENRGWGPAEEMIGRRIWLHASKSRQAIEPEDLLPPFFDASDPVPSLSDLPTGAIVGSFKLVSVTLSSTSPWYMPGSVAWNIAEPLPLRVPVPARGSLGLWVVSPDILLELRAA